MTTKKSTDGTVIINEKYIDGYACPSCASTNIARTKMSTPDIWDPERKTWQPAASIPLDKTHYECLSCEYTSTDPIDWQDIAFYDDGPRSILYEPQDIFIAGYQLTLTCAACPEQYNVHLDNKQVGYLRLRHGSFTVNYPNFDGVLLYMVGVEGDGMFTPQERRGFLTKAIEEISKRHERNSQSAADAKWLLTQLTNVHSTLLQIPRGQSFDVEAVDDAIRLAKQYVKDWLDKDYNPETGSATQKES